MVHLILFCIDTKWNSTTKIPTEKIKKIKNKWKMSSISLKEICLPVFVEYAESLIIFTDGNLSRTTSKEPILHEGSPC